VPSIVAVLLAVGAVLSLATLLAFAVERPAMRAIRRVWRQRHPAQPLAVAGH
jgi:peptidoglycan/LPS O-acetylase OafA/YrhL